MKVSIKDIVINSDKYNNFIKQCRKIYFTGIMGSGKSTIIQNLKFDNKYIIVYIPEYIIGLEEGESLFIDDNISKYYLQDCILKYYDIYLNKVAMCYCDNNPNSIILVFDRYPEDTVYNFANYYKINDLISETEYDMLIDYLNEINEKYNLISYTNNIFTENQNNDESSIIYKYLISKNIKETQCLINIYINSDKITNDTLFIINLDIDISRERIIRRSRFDKEKYINYNAIYYQYYLYENLKNFLCNNRKLLTRLFIKHSTIM